jgi:ribA/ribD-fused uncharacterized protein
MTNPVHNKINPSTIVSGVIPISTSTPIPVSQSSDILRMTQSAQGSFSLWSIWDGIVNCFKSLFSYFFRQDHLPDQMKASIAKIATRDRFIWFYEKKENPLTAFLGNFHPCPINLWGMKFRCAEGAFQAGKFAPDKDLMERFQNLNGEAAFHLGRELSQNWGDREKNHWRSRNLAVMREVVTAKFTQNRDLQELLLATGEAYLVEHIPGKRRHKDTFWGDGGNGEGQNWLGKIAMEVRGSLGGVGTVLRNAQYNQFLYKQIRRS